MSTERAMTCAELEGLSAELALGAVSGAERASALSHLAGCGGCRQLVDDLARVADRLLLLAPAAEPPPGFESRVLSRMGPILPRARRSRRRALAGVAAVALVAGLSGAGAATLLGDGAAPLAGAVRTAVAADDEGRWTCRAVVYGESPTWLVVSLDRSDGMHATFSVEAVRAGSAEGVPVGDLSIADGHGSLATVVDLLPAHVDAVRVRDAGGRVRYTVDLPAT